MMSKIEISAGERTVRVQMLGLTRRQRTAAKQAALALFLAAPPQEPTAAAGPVLHFGFGPPESSTTSDHDPAQPNYEAGAPARFTPLPMSQGRAAR